jgi:penicillin-binding protein 2
MTTHGRRLLALQVLAVCMFALLGLQLMRIQVLNAEHYRRVAAEQQVRKLPVEPPRGVIVDRNGVVLARNRPAFAVAIVPGDLPTDAGERRSVLLQVERETGTRIDALEAAVNAGERSVDPFEPVRVRSGLDTDGAIAMRAALADLPGVRVEASPVRVYEGGDLLPNILGYVGLIEPDQVESLRARGYPLDAYVGQAGVEAVYEQALRGTPGRLLVAADPRGRELARLGSVPPTPGSDVVLSIDLELQRAATDALRSGIAKGLPPSGRDADGRPALQAGAAVVLDVRSGEVLAMVSHPSYDANTFSGRPDPVNVERLLSDPARPLLHRAYMEVHAPGSIFKTIVGLAALQEGVATTRTLITSNGAIVVPSQYDPSVQYVFRDWAAHGTLDFDGGIARSSDVYFYYLAGGFQQFEGLGAARVAQYARAFGLGSETGLDLPGEAGGLVPDADWKMEAVGEPWVLGDTYTYGIGQGYLTTTPLQMAVATAALANGGEVLVPRVVRATRTGGVEQPTARETRGRLPADRRHIDAVRTAMLAAASTGGTATEGKPPGIAIGAKTGTAEFGTMRVDGSPNGSYDSHAWFIAFAPYEQPEIAVVVYLEHGTGAIHAGPVTRRILEAYFAQQRAG